MQTLTALRYVLPLLLLWPCAAHAQKPWRDVLTSVALSPDGELVATGSLNQSVMLWNEGPRPELAALRAHTSYVYAVAFSRDGKTLASGSGDRTVRLWDVETRAARRTLEGHEASIESLAFSPDGKTLGSGDHFGVVTLWEFASGRRLRALDQAGPAASHLAFSADGRLLASGGDGDAFVWEVATGRRLGAFSVNRFIMTALALSPDGSTAAAAGCSVPRFLKVKCSVRLWDAATGRERHSLGVPSGLEALAFSRDGKLLAGAGSSAAPRLWDASTGALVATLEEVKGIPFSLTFDDGAQKLTGAYGFYYNRPPGRVVWDVGTRKHAAVPATGLLPLAPMERADAYGPPSTPGGGGPGVGLGPGRGQDTGQGTGGELGPVDYSRVFTASQVTVKARITSKPEPSFTERARKDNIVGTVRLRAVLAASGEVTDIQTIRELPYFLTDEAVRAARAIKFTPATKDGRTVSQYITLDYHFNIY